MRGGEGTQGTEKDLRDLRDLRDRRGGAGADAISCLPPEGGCNELRPSRGEGFTLVEVLVALGVLVGLACAVSGVVAACGAAEERARRDAEAARVVASLYAEARMDAGAEPREVPGEEGRWAVVASGGERVAVAEGDGVALRRRVEAMERREGGGEVAFEVMTEAALP